MKKILFSLFLSFALLNINGQSCNDFMKYVKSQGSGNIYSSVNSEAISKVTFYQLTIDYKTHYYAIVCFKKEYSFNCSEYIYEVSSTTKFNYALNYMNSAGKAFWEYIHPYKDVLRCAPNFK